MFSVFVFLICLVVSLSLRMPPSVYININMEKEAKETKLQHLDVLSEGLVSRMR